MDEIVLNRIKFTVSDLSLWESFLTDVLDLSVAPTPHGLVVKIGALNFELVQGDSAPLEWEFQWASSERDVMLSRWSFYQYRGSDSIRLNVVEDKFLFEIDTMSRIAVHFEPTQRRELPYPTNSVVRNF